MNGCDGRAVTCRLCVVDSGVAGWTLVWIVGGWHLSGVSTCVDVPGVTITLC